MQRNVLLIDNAYVRCIYRVKCVMFIFFSVPAKRFSGRRCKVVTIKDVAKQANVSIATVSAVINGTKFVSEELTERINHAIEDLEYRPNRVARSLKRKKSKLIGVTVTEITNPFYPQMLKGVDDIAIENGYNVILCTTEDEPDKEYDLLLSLIDQGVDGIVLATIDKNASSSIELLKKEKIPHVLINRAPANYEGNKVTVNSYKVGKVATDYLISLGHTDIAFIGGERLNSIDREKGYKDSIIENGLNLRSDRIIMSDYHSNGAYDTTNSLIATGDLPTAIFTASDVMAFGVIKALLNSGYKVPEDISVIGSDNISFSEDFRIPLTTIDAHTYDIGRMGCEVLLNELRNKDQNDDRKILLEPKLIIRESTNPVKTGKD